MTSVPKVWHGSTIVCIGTGPSLTHEDVEFCRDKARVIAINDAYTVAPWADVLYACDVKWWKWHNGVPAFTGLKYALAPKTNDRIGDQVIRQAGIQALQNHGTYGLSLDPTGVSTGHNSGYQAINVALHFGASRIVLLGYDMGRSPKQASHFFGEHRDRSQPPYERCLAAFATLVAPLRAASVDVVNSSRHSALRCFPQITLEESLAIQHVPV